jgi:hypothetical protein
METYTDDNKICIHNYLKTCETVITPPGFLDFLRGTIALFKYSKKYNYKLYINKAIHPIFKYFNDCEYYIYDEDKTNLKNTFELLSQVSCEYVDYITEKLFQNSNKIFVITNCFLENKQICEDYDANDSIGESCRIFLKKLLTPVPLLKSRLDDIYTGLNIDSNSEYSCIHIRFGDKFLNTKYIDYNILTGITDTINNIVLQSNMPVILISDSSEMSKMIKIINKKIHYWDSKKIHLGSLFLNYNEDMEDAILDTLCDILLLSKSKKIYTINCDPIFRTTFSPLISKIYGISNIFYQNIYYT